MKEIADDLHLGALKSPPTRASRTSEGAEPQPHARTPPWRSDELHVREALGAKGGCAVSDGRECDRGSERSGC
eukprot:4566121-Prymnesium_polylepis.1